jgi:hypothetical protein
MRLMRLMLDMSAPGPVPANVCCTGVTSLLASSGCNPVLRESSMNWYRGKCLQSKPVENTIMVVVLCYWKTLSDTG